VKKIGRRNFLRITASAGCAACAPLSLFAAAAGRRRWAMIVDLKKCREQNNCTLCLSACHKAHNVPGIGNSKDEVKWVWKDGFENVFPDQVHDLQPEALRHSQALLLCNHCDKPPCVGVCPTQATWKREPDGLVMMDWHRCIGCRYCMAACPYGSRSFNWRDPRPFIRETTADFPTRMRGVVEKCNFCEERLAQGRLPACVAACTAGALTFGDLRDPESPAKRLLQSNFTIRRRPGLGTLPQVYYIL
jgi:molybdopterin-containing oxidoreductase family iron-sulfur binding subunit